VNIVVTNGIVGAQAVSDIEVQSVAPAQGRQNQPQWMITATVPWSQYPERFWIDAVQGVQPIAPGNHHCAFTISRQKPNTSGDAPFHYRFILTNVDYVGGGYPNVMNLQFGGSAPPSAPSGAPAPGLGVSRDESIVRQSSIKAVMDAKVAALNNATRLVAEGHIIPADDEPVEDRVRFVTGHILQGLMADVPTWVEYVVAIVNRQVAEDEYEPDPDA
tara:strand:- start:44 stop:694 length:651 start_codon:yes stop_codon:yes gene_type:complete